MCQESTHDSEWDSVSEGDRECVESAYKSMKGSKREYVRKYGYVE